MLTSSHVNKTLVLRIYLLSLPRKSEKSVKIGNRKPYGEPLIWGGHPGRDIRREQVRGDTPTPHMQSLLASVFPPPKGGHGALGVHGDGDGDASAKGFPRMASSLWVPWGPRRRLHERPGPHGPPLGGEYTREGLAGVSIYLVFPSNPPQMAPLS